MQDLTSPYEYVVGQKKTASLRLRRAGLIALYILFPIVVLVVVATSRVGSLFAPLCAFLAIATWMLVFFTWRYVSVEYEYTVVSGRLTFSKIYGGRSRKKVLELMLRDADRIAPLTDDAVRELSRSGLDKTYSALSAPDAEDAYFMTFKAPSGERCVFYFEATAQMLKLCRFYNASSTVVTKVRF